MTGVAVGMTAHTATSPLADRLDKALLRRLERRASAGGPPRPDARAAAVLMVATGAVTEIARFCRYWGLDLAATPTRDGGAAVLRVDGPVLAVEGLAELAARGAL